MTYLYRTLNLNAYAKKADITFNLDSNNQCLQSEFLVVEGDVVKYAVPFNFTRGYLDLVNDQYPWTASVVNSYWNDTVDVLRFVFNIDHHPRK